MKQTFNKIDRDDDYNRLTLGIQVARGIAAKRLMKDPKLLTMEDLIKAGPILVYNGHLQQNQELNDALKYGDISTYPAEKFKILPLDPKQLNTHGLFISFKNAFTLDNTSIALVTHAYHFPRISRMFSKNPQHLSDNQNIKIYAFLVDKEFCSPGINKNVQGEIKRLQNYYLQGIIANSAYQKIIYKQRARKISIKFNYRDKKFFY
ncbi:MAG: YdcF family protein [Silvanigrellaceae bacterium]|nr:YdcF family protein [Silvanigrellaceae bacterium]